MVDLTTVPVPRLKEMLNEAVEAERLAEFDDVASSYIARVGAARQAKQQLRAEIDRRVAQYEAINGR